MPPYAIRWEWDGDGDGDGAEKQLDCGEKSFLAV